MTVRLGSIELTAVQRIRTGESRRVVELAVPGRRGSLVQDLGRPLIALHFEGTFAGEQALSALESLRRAHADGAPLRFAADILSGLDFTDVVLESLDVHEVGGFPRWYRYALTVREHVDEPVPESVELASVDAEVDADAAAWSDGSVAAVGAIDDPTTLPAVAAADPAVLDHLDTADIQGAVTDNAEGLDGGALGKIVDGVGGPDSPLGAAILKLKDVKVTDVVAAYQAIQDPSKLPGLLKDNPEMLERLGVSDLADSLGEQLEGTPAAALSDIVGALAKDPEKLVGFVDHLTKAKNIGEFMTILADEGTDLLGDLAGVDLGPAAAVIKIVAGGTDLLKHLASVAESGQKLLASLRGFDPVAPLRVPGPEGVP